MSEDANIGRVLEGKYALVRVLGTGGMGTVYEATHLLIKRRLAVKLLHEEYAKEPLFAERFKREAQTASAIGHDHIVDVTDMGSTEKGELFIVMEYLDGADLASVLKEQDHFDTERACHIMVQVLSALESAHSKGIVHRDLKPANIFLINHQGTEDYVKLVDFGISKMRQEDSDMAHNLTRTGELLGTPSFMSPEQARGELSIDAKSDVFSAGVILYKLLTGNLPFEDKVLTMLLMKILHDAPPHPCELNATVPRNLGNAVIRAMCKNPAERLDASAFRRIVQAYSPDTPSRAGLKVTLYRDTANSFLLNRIRHSTPFQTELSDSRPSWRRRKQVAVLFGVALAALIAVAAAVSVFKSRRPAPPAAVVSVVTSPPKVAPPMPKEKPRTVVPPLLETISIGIVVSPKHAAVQVDGVAVGEGDVEYTTPADGRTHEIIVVAPGYRALRDDVVFDRDKKLSFQLEKTNGDGVSSEPLVRPSSASPAAKGVDTPRDRQENATVHGHLRGSASDDPSSSKVPAVHKSATAKGENPLSTPPSNRSTREIDELNPW